MFEVIRGHFQAVGLLETNSNLILGLRGEGSKGGDDSKPPGVDAFSAEILKSGDKLPLHFDFLMWWNSMHTLL